MESSMEWGPIPAVSVDLCHPCSTAAATRCQSPPGLRGPTGIKIQFEYGDSSWSEASFERVEDAIAFLRRFRR
jgi:hypothetical protein